MYSPSGHLLWRDSRITHKKVPKMKKEKDENIDRIKEKFLERFFPEKNASEFYCSECFKKLMAELRLRES